MSNKRDYYEVLGVDRSASDKEIKRAYRKKAMSLHPDRYDGPKEEGEEKFKELNEAYSILSDEKQRQLYDQFGFAGVENGAQSAHGADPFEFFSSIFDFDLGDLFGGGFGRSRSRRSRGGPQRGDDVVLDLELTYEEAYEGVSKKITMPYNSPCNKCNGSRAEPGSDFKTCRNCGGSGVVEKQEQRGFFVQISRQPCSNCGGSGRVPEKLCTECNGTGKSDKRESIKVNIPKGINQGEHVRIKGKGRPSNSGGMPGDLIFRIYLKNHDIFERNDLDVYMKLPISYPTMVLGGEVKVPLISGKGNSRSGKLKVPAKTNINDVLRIRNEGFERKVRGNNVTGDAYFVITLDVPNKVTKKMKNILKELQEEMES